MTTKRLPDLDADYTEMMRDLIIIDDPVPFKAAVERQMEQLTKAIVHPIKGEMFTLSTVQSPTKLSIAINTAMRLPVGSLLLTYVGEKSGYVHREVMPI